jgi:two-component system phosphate regulon sensor histidine kinase PhoR
MHRKRLLWQLYPSYLLITIFALLAVIWFVSRLLHDFHLEETAADLETRARLLEQRFSDLPLDDGRADSLCKQLGRKTSTRITVVLPSGKVIADSETDPADMDNHADRPEIIEALAGRTGVSTRYSYTVKDDLIYVAVPMTKADAIIGAVRVSIPLTGFNRTLQTIRLQIVSIGLLIALCAAGATLVISRRASRPLEELKRAAQRFAGGDLNRAPIIPADNEFADLADAMTEMAGQLDDRITALARQSTEQEVVLSSMTEGVLAVDARECLLNVNRAAAQLLGVDPAESRGRSLPEIVRNTELQRVVRQTLSSGQPVEGEVALQGGGERFVRVRGANLRNAQGRSIGAVIVLSDVTNLRRLENVRRDFVANVSHELKTPVTSIKGFVETLLDGAIREPAEAERFLRIIAKQANRLEAIIDDLLNLAKIERERERGEIHLEPAPLSEPLRAAIQTCEAQAAARQIRIELKCPEDLAARINPALLEQALVNLIDNAIKYSESGGRIEIEASQTSTDTVISVRDEGCGIEEQHLARIFERFYRVDKARSRTVGGTGLGLAIVKHIAQAHGGGVSVQSAPGKGSVFCIYLPRDASS